MRKLPITLVTFLLLLQGCSALDFIPGSAGANTPVPSSTATNTPSITPTPTRTSTATPRDTVTPIGAFPTFTPFVLVSADAPTSMFTPTPLPLTGGFESVSITQGKIFYGSCKQNFTKMTVQVDNPVEAKTVYLFMRLESGKRPGDTTRWYGTVTDSAGGGMFFYTLRANNIPERKNFSKAWVQYQFVAVDKYENILGRSPIYTRTLALEPCK